MRTFLIALLLTTPSILAQSESNQPSYAWMGADMLRSTPSLVKVALSTRFFLDLDGELKLTEGQRQKLEEIDFQTISELLERSAELQVATSELSLLLSRPRINLDAVDMAVARQESFRSEIEIVRIHKALEAIEVISHEQHRRAILLAREPQPRQ